MEVKGKESGQGSSWLDKEGNLFEYSGQAPSPSKDFCQIIVGSDQVSNQFEQTVYAKSITPWFMMYHSFIIITTVVQ